MRTDTDRENRLDELVPLFRMVFAHSDAKEIIESFPDAPTFALYATKRLVKEVKKRASKQSRQDASRGEACCLLSLVPSSWGALFVATAAVLPLPPPRSRC